MRKRIAFIYLPIIALIPIAVGAYQTMHFLNWLLDLEWNFDWAINFVRLSHFTLALCFIISLYEHFCLYYRMVISGALYCALSYHLSDYFPSILSYNITNILAILLIFVGIIGCFIHFGMQIKDFVRYVRTKR